jgi:hypothetical protein
VAGAIWGFFEVQNRRLQFTNSEVQRVVQALNQVSGIDIEAQFTDKAVTLEGEAVQFTDIENITPGAST